MAVVIRVMISLSARAGWAAGGPGGARPGSESRFKLWISPSAAWLDTAAHWQHGGTSHRDGGPSPSHWHESHCDSGSVTPTVAATEWHSDRLSGWQPEPERIHDSDSGFKAYSNLKSATDSESETGSVAAMPAAAASGCQCGGGGGGDPGRRRHGDAALS
jgi:hypothetical protein